MILEHVISTAGALAAVASLPGTLELALLTAGAMLPRRTRIQSGKPLQRIAVIVPAHNEEHSIARTIQCLSACERFEELATLYVVADNCTDGTALVASDLRALVIVRHDDSKRGKGYALQHALSLLLPLDFAGFLIVDADTTAEPNLIVEVCGAFADGLQALQCPYLVSNPGDSSSTRLMALALRGFNFVRPRGRGRLGLSSGILGNGFALSREVVQRVPYTAHSVVEDLEYHIELQRAGVNVHFLETTGVFGIMPAGGQGRATQRARWEGGRLRVLRDRWQWLFSRALRGEWRFAEVLGDLLLLPLAFHILLILAAAAIPYSRLAGLAGLFTLAIHLAVIIGAGHTPGRDLRTLLQAPAYVIWKLALLPRTIAASAKSASWVRTARSQEESAA